MKQFLLLGISILVVSACAPHAPPPPAAPAAMVQPVPGSTAYTTTAFDGDYGNAVAKSMTPGCPDIIAATGLTIKNGFVQFRGANLTFYGYINPQGGLSLTTQQGQTFQGRIDPNFVLTGRATGPNCVYDASWSRIRAV